LGVSLVVMPLGSFPLDDAWAVAGEVKSRTPVDIRVAVSPWRITLPLTLYEWGRMQFRADLVVEYLYDSLGGVEARRRLVLGLSEADGFIPGFNYVFGLADPGRGVGVVFTARLRQGVGREKYIERVVKEALHELGHLLGLGHCENRECVMSYSNSLAEVDAKSGRFCRKCELRLREIVGDKS